MTELKTQNTKENLSDSNWIDKAFSHPDRTINIGTLFSGIGAIEYAFKRLNLKTNIIFAGDINPHCKETYFANYDISEDRWHSDVTNFDASIYKDKIDLLVGGAPCQAFSIVGDQLGFNDTRGTLFREFARVVKECQPKVFIFENVQGLLKHDDGKTWQVMYNTFKNYCGYDIHFQLLNARNYGIPQTRERLFCVGFKNATEFKYPAPIELKYRMYDFLEDYIDTPFFDKNHNQKIITPYSDRKDILASNCDKERFNEFIFKVNEIEDKFYLSEKTAYYVLAGGTKNFKTSTETDLDIARPLLQTMHKMHRAGVDNYVTYKKDKGVNGIRKLTPRECFRLMGFKDDFVIPVANTNAYKQAGNSIVVDVLIAILKQMDITKYGRDDILNKEQPKKLQLATTFSGIGAVEQACKRSGIDFDIVFAGDIDNNCKQSYFANYDITDDKWHSDVTNFDASIYKDKIDLLVGGAPCQAFSLRGKHGGFNDTRGTLFREFARLIIETQPKVFIFENVPGMLSHDKGRTWSVIKNTFKEDCGYDIHFSVLNAKDFGIPQRRERLFCVGFKEKRDFKFPKSKELKTTLMDFLTKDIDKKYFLKTKGVNFISKALNIKKRYTQINGDICLCQKRNQQFNWHGDFVYHPLSKSIDKTQIADCVFNPHNCEDHAFLNNLNKAYILNQQKGNTFSLSKDEQMQEEGVFRKLSPRECLSLMGFGDDFKLVVSDTELYKQSGNSIVVNVLIELLKAINIRDYVS